MPCVDVSVSCEVYDSFRVQQAAGMFDVPLTEKLSERFTVELPDLDAPWQVGLIVGPSGSGKSSVARAAYGEQLYSAQEWAEDRAVIDVFEHLPVQKVIELFTAVGFSSPPSWVKPYRVLSGGEQFRCDLARALSAPCDSQLVVFDEFTSVVDRRVAKACSTAIAKGVRRGSLPRFVAVTCHYDVAEWLEADWVLDMSLGTLARRRLRRPAIELEIHRAHVAAWQLFARHHYLNPKLPAACRCYLATWDGEPVAFAATVPLIGRKDHRRFTRIVVLPDFQGMGVGMKFVAAVASLHRKEGHRVNVTSSHPALVRHCRHSPVWRTVCVKRTGTSRHGSGIDSNYRSSAGRAVVSFEYVG